MDTKVKEPIAGQCPFTNIAGVGRTNRDWWPNQLRLELPPQPPPRISATAESHRAEVCL